MIYTKEPSSTFTITLSRKAKDWQGRRQLDVMLGFYVYQYDQKSLDPKLSQILNPAQFLPMNEVSETVTLPEVGDYIVMCCLFRAGECGKFDVQVQSKSQFVFKSMQL